MLLGDGMARAYSSDLRVRVIRAVEGGFSARGAGRRLGIGESTATAWVGRWRRTGSAEAKSQKCRSRSPLKAHTAWLLALIGERADLTLERNAPIWRAIPRGQDGDRLRDAVERVQPPDAHKPRSFIT